MVEKQKYRTIIFYKDYFQDFFVKQREKARDKIIRTLEQFKDRHYGKRGTARRDELDT
jgi:hypothetical protein